MENLFYVYLHKKQTNGEIFYVGKGKGRRAFARSRRSDYWNRVVNKYGLEVEILFGGLSEEEAFQCEIDAISELRYFGINLVNMTNGGEGVSGHTRSKEAIEKTRQANLGIKRSPENIEKIRELRLGKTHSVETKERMKLTRVKNPPFIDRTIYTFFNRSGDLFIGTRKQLADHCGFDVKSLGNLFLKNNPYKSSKGWSLLTNDLLMILCILNNDMEK